MKTRTRERTITFKGPVILAGLDEVLPAGDYGVETEEELIAGISHPAYRRISTVAKRQETLTENPAGLDEHRGVAAQKAAEIRRERFHQFQEVQAGLRRSQKDLPRFRKFEEESSCLYQQ